jgi:hypothetical protein
MRYGFKKAKNTPKMTKNESKMNIKCFQFYRFLEKSTLKDYEIVLISTIGFLISKIRVLNIVKLA